MNTYCFNRFRTVRRPTREVMVGSVGVGGTNPIRVQSMTTSDTKDVAATVKESIALAEAGCEIIRITAPNKTAAACLKKIRAELHRHRIDVPLVADIHFLPAAAMEAVEHVEKIRINPGNYADRKKFSIREYSDDQYAEELDRLHEAFSPIVKRCRDLGRAMRIGTNHGSLSDRIMNRYGDTPRGMVESALEFIRIAESHNYRDIILSMKASNPKIMIEAYRLLVAQMEKEQMYYPLHLGVTEAGDGEDGRVKSAIGIGSLLADGLGDTIRVSLTEDAVYEVPVARAIADKIMTQWKGGSAAAPEQDAIYLNPDRRVYDSIDPFRYNPRKVAAQTIAPGLLLGPGEPPRVIIPYQAPDKATEGLPEDLVALLKKAEDTPIEGLLLDAQTPARMSASVNFAGQLKGRIPWLVFDIGNRHLSSCENTSLSSLPGVKVGLVRTFQKGDQETLTWFLAQAALHQYLPILAIPFEAFPALREPLEASARRNQPMLFTLSDPEKNCHAIGAYRLLAENLRTLPGHYPLWIRHRESLQMSPAEGFLDHLLEASFLLGSLLCDGLGDVVSIETTNTPAQSLNLVYTILQGAGARISKTEFVACPSCGRTLFNLQDTTQRIRAQTGHLKGVKIAIMGCIVNGPGEMADADFGYVGGAPGKVNLYVGKECVQFHVPQEDADRRLIELIKAHGKWQDPKPTESADAVAATPSS